MNTVNRRTFEERLAKGFCYATQAKAGTKFHSWLGLVVLGPTPDQPLMGVPLAEPLHTSSASAFPGRLIHEKTHPPNKSAKASRKRQQTSCAATATENLLPVALLAMLRRRGVREVLGSIRTR